MLDCSRHAAPISAVAMVLVVVAVKMFVLLMIVGRHLFLAWGAHGIVASEFI